MTTVLELRGITKAFPGVLANDHIDLTLEKGEIHALLGENGAGKSTLMNILYGLYKPDEGEILVRGKHVVIHTPNDAIALGIGMVHQHFMLVPVMTVTENVMLGNEPTRSGLFLDKASVAGAFGIFRANTGSRSIRIPTSRTCLWGYSSASKSSRSSIDLQTYSSWTSQPPC